MPKPLFCGIYNSLPSTFLSRSRLVLEFMPAGTGVYTGWYWSLCRLVLEYIAASASFKANILQSRNDDAFGKEAKYDSGKHLVEPLLHTDTEDY